MPTAMPSTIEFGASAKIAGGKDVEHCPHTASNAESHHRPTKIQTRNVMVIPVKDSADNKTKRFSFAGDIARPRRASIAVRHSRPPSSGRNGRRLNNALAMENSPINRTPVAPGDPISPPKRPDASHNIKPKM